MAIVEPLPPTADGRRQLQVRNPITNEILEQNLVTNLAEVLEAVERARSAQEAWSAWSFKARGAVFLRAMELLIARRETVIDHIVAETGRSRLETLFMEIFPACDALHFFAHRAGKILKDRTVGLHLMKMKKAKLVYQPLGVIGVITPWNGPFIMCLNPCVQALMAGNAVLLKPSEVTPGTARVFAELLQEAGLPENLLQVVQGDGETGAALIEAGVDKISFTGSVSTGRKVGEACGRALIPCTLELGGKDAMIICADADLERAAGGAVFGAMFNNGQYCSSTERVYVVDAIADAFTEQVVARVAALRQDPEQEYDLGPFIFQRQLSKVESQVNAAVSAGAKVLVGGRRAEGLGEHFFEPTVLVDVTHEMAIMCEETFGPVLPIVRVRDEDEAIRLANDTKYGLGASVFTKDKKRGEAIARRLRAGSVSINDAAITYGALELPFGGWNESGVGQVNGESGLRGYCHAQPILIDRFGMAAEYVWFPYTAEKFEKLVKGIFWMFQTPLRWFLR